MSRQSPLPVGAFTRGALDFHYKGGTFNTFPTWGEFHRNAPNEHTVRRIEETDVALRLSHSAFHNGPKLPLPRIRTRPYPRNSSDTPF